MLGIFTSFFKVLPIFLDIFIRIQDFRYKNEMSKKLQNFAQVLNKFCLKNVDTALKICHFNYVHIHKKLKI